MYSPFEVVVGVLTGSTSRENKDTFGFGATFPVFCGVAGVLICGVEVEVEGVDAFEFGFWGFFFAGFLATDNGLNINGFPTNLTSSAGFCSSTKELGGGKFNPDPLVPSSSSSGSSVVYSLSCTGSGSLLKAGAAPVFKLTPAPKPLFRAPFPPPNVALVDCPVLFGAGKNELNPLKAPPPVFARFVGGSSVLVSSFKDACGNETRILPGFDLSTTFWNVDLPVADVDVDGFGAVTSGESESSESE